MKPARLIVCFCRVTTLPLAALIHPSLLSAGPELYNHMDIPCGDSSKNLNQWIWTSSTFNHSFVYPLIVDNPPKNKLSYAYWRVFRIKIQLAKLYQSVKTNGRVDISPVHHRMIVAIPRGIRDWTAVFNATYCPDEPGRATRKHLSTRHCPPALITDQVCCSKSTSCAHSSSAMTPTSGWQILVWLSSNRHRIGAPPWCSRNQRNTTGGDGLTVWLRSVIRSCTRRWKELQNVWICWP